MDELLKELNELNLQEGKYVIVGSGPLGVRGIRESQDLDILVADELWDELSHKFQVIKKGENTVIRISENIEALGKKTFLDEPEGSPTVEEQIKEAEIIRGYPFQSIEHFKFFKSIGRRQKDIDDIDLLEAWTRRQN